MPSVQPFFPFRCGAVVKAIKFALDVARLLLIQHKRNSLCVSSVVVFTVVDVEHEEALDFSFLCHDVCQINVDLKVLQVRDDAGSWGQNFYSL
eukprot:14090630-Ditylum_brightwellii.AAC.1